MNLYFMKLLLNLGVGISSGMIRDGIWEGGGNPTVNPSMPLSYFAIFEKVSSLKKVIFCMTF